MWNLPSGRGRLEIADGREDIRSNDVARGDAAHLLIEMVMAERSVTGIVGGGTALAVGAEVLAAITFSVVLPEPVRSMVEQCS